ncbi:MAG: GNAT family N-acetyltransferase [Ginsengibacter sp.]
MNFNSYNIVNNEKQMQFEIEENGKTAYLPYRYYKKDVAFLNTYVPVELREKGMAGALAKAAFEFAKKLNKPVIAYCPFVASFIKKHTEYNGQLDPEFHKDSQPPGIT